MVFDLVNYKKFKFSLLYLGLIRNLLKSGLFFSILELSVLMYNYCYKI
jgi:hypothetical protein